MLLHRTDEQEKIIPLLDSLKSDEKVVATMSYPSIMLKERTSDEMIGFIREMSLILPAGAESIDSTMLTPDLLDIVYYAAAHPERMAAAFEYFQSSPTASPAAARMHGAAPME